MYCMSLLFFFFKQKTAYDMRISDWSSDVCSSDLPRADHPGRRHCRGDGGARRRADAQPGGESARSRHADASIDPERAPRRRARGVRDRKRVVEGKRVSVGVDLGGRRNIRTQKELRIHKVTQQI